MTDVVAALRAVPRPLWDDQHPGAPSRWLPLVLVSQSGLWLGLDEVGKWVIGRRGGRTEVARDAISPSWLPLLDLDPSELAAEIAEAADNHKLPAVVLQEELSLDATITLALTSRNRHWIERAVTWLSTRKPRPEQLPLLARVADAKWVNQRTRHRASKLVNADEQ